jgi:RimJ/RimL family protein N-acetyltransferase
MNVRPVTLEGSHVRLAPLSLAHVDALSEIGLDASLWKWTTAQIETHDEMRQYVEDALKAQSAGTAIPFVTIEHATGRIVGSTRFGNLDQPNRKVEIGWTWVAPPWQRSAINTEAKYLMLKHAFEVWGCIRVELKTDALNERSRAAILRLGAKQEGIMRNHMITASGRYRDSVYFSIIESEWPGVKAGLEEKLNRRLIVP